MRMFRFFLILMLVALPTLGQAGWLDTVKEAGDSLLEEQTSSSDSSSSSYSSITNAEAIKGLKAALKKAVKTSVASLGTTDGFMNNDDVKIPLPDSLGQLESALRLAGQDELADQFVTSMNRAAEQAVPLTKGVIVKAIQNMTFDDALAILKGGDTAATEYFQRTMTSDLKEKVEPVVSEATESVDVTKYYKNMVQAASSLGVDSEMKDLDDYVTDKTLEGLFYVMGEEEKEIRENPVARTSSILKKVFGSE